MSHATAKTQGIHYTPPELAQFLARLLASQLPLRCRELRVLDPACGDGALLSAFAQALPATARARLTLVGYETDRTAIAAADSVLRPLTVKQLTLVEGDFLAAATGSRRPGLPGAGEGAVPPAGFDAVIANPPYVRTQVLGARRAGSLAAEFGLTGRVDLYHAFARAMADVLKPGGVLGLLVSNRFLTVKSGAALRAMLRTQFALKAIYDLGDTRLFAAAVLPVIVVATKKTPSASVRCRFDRIYQDRSPGPGSGPTAGRRPAAANCVPPIQAVQSVLAALGDAKTSGLIRAPTGLFRIERGFLSSRPPEAIWTLSNDDSEGWLKVVERHVGPTFDVVGRVRVGIKTTADQVFIRDDWQALPRDRRPECELLRPLLRHFGAARWLSGVQRQTVLYPHVVADGRRRAIDLTDFPRASRYLEGHRQRLSRRQYVVDSGRQWYEIWVPHHPHEWTQPKIVFPDIAEQPRFFLDCSGAIVNGDCYWITLRPGRPADWLLLMLAVANSSFIVRYYDTSFHNQLYAGRRRFMTQYVKHFPLPDIESHASQGAIARVRELVMAPVAPLTASSKRVASQAANDRMSRRAELEQEVDALVWQAFGLTAPAERR
ncbi:MAG TPA: N-6 DNA methylase [Pirellulales bacterium]|jgi:methylase of polypeptide subunit release factors|nr:N-6 DNA methylase [Pirellulales bacterium]